MHIQGSKPNFKLLSNTIVFYFVHLHNIKETMHTLLVRLQVFYMFLIEVKYRVLKNVNLILIIWRAGEAASDRMYKHRQVCWEIMTRHHCYWHLTAWTKQGIVSHFNIYTWLEHEADRQNMQRLWSDLKIVKIFCIGSWTCFCTRPNYKKLFISF